MFLASVSTSSHSGSASDSRSMFTFSKKKTSGETPYHHPQKTTPNAVLSSHPAPTQAAATHDKVPVVTTAVDKLQADALATHLTPSPMGDSVPPPYAPYGHKVVEVEQGVYAVEEPPTLARVLFFYGFLFFPFWFAGIYILFTPLRPTPDWEAGKTEDEKMHLLQVLRRTEKKWAWRCLIALLGLTVTVSILIIIIKYGILSNI